MEKRGSALAWAVAVLAVLGLIASLVWGFAMQRRVQELTQQVVANESAGQALNDQAEKQTEQVRRLQETVTKLEQQLAAGAAAEETAAVPAETAEAGDTAGETAASAETPPAQEQAQAGLQNMMNMFEGEQGQKFAEMSANAAIPMMYGDLLEQLALPADAEEKVRNILRDHMVRQIKASSQFMKDGGQGDPKKLEAELNANLRKDLAEVLNENGLAMYDEYQDGIEEKMLRKSFNMQMGMFAPGLTEENRTMAVDVLVEEMSQIQSNNMDMSPAAVNAAMDAFERTRERLSTVLDEQQMAQFNAFLQQQKAGIEIWQNMMTAQDKAPAPAPAPKVDSQ